MERKRRAFPDAFEREAEERSAGAVRRRDRGALVATVDIRSLSLVPRRPCRREDAAEARSHRDKTKRGIPKKKPRLSSEGPPGDVRTRPSPGGGIPERCPERRRRLTPPRGADRDAKPRGCRLGGARDTACRDRRRHGINSARSTPALSESPSRHKIES